MAVFIIEKMKLDKMALSIVDKGASGDADNPPEIVLFKRKNKAAKMLEALRKMFTGTKIDVEKLGLSQLVGAIDELGLNDEQKAGVLKLLEAFKGGAEAAPAPEPDTPKPAEKQEDEPGEAPPAEEENEEMAKRAKEHAADLAKRDKRIEKLEDEAQTLRLEKRADELGFLPGYSREETIELLKKADGDPKFDEMLTKLAKASKDSPLLRAAGAVSHEDGNSASVRLAKRVKVLQDKDPELSIAEARTIAYENDHELFKAVKDAAATSH